MSFFSFQYWYIHFGIVRYKIVDVFSAKIGEALSLLFLILIYHTRVFECVCVCVGERERELEGLLLFLDKLIPKKTIKRINHLAHTE